MRTCTSWIGGGAVCRMPGLGLWARGFGDFEGFLTSWHMSGANMDAREVRA